MKKTLIISLLLSFSLIGCTEQPTPQASPQPEATPTPTVSSTPEIIVQPTPLPTPIPSPSPTTTPQRLPQPTPFPTSASSATPSPARTPIPTRTPLPFPSQGLLAYYPFNATAIDDSGNGNNGTINNAILTADKTGQASRAYLFNGETAFIELSNNNLNFINKLSFVAWIKIGQNFSEKPRLFSKGTEELLCCDDFALILFPQNNSKYKFGYSVKSGVEESKNKTELNQDTFYHIGLTYDGTTFKYYINGQLDFEEKQTQVFNNEATHIRLGKGRQNLNHFKGIIDEVLIYNRDLSAEEIANIFKQQS